MPYRVYFLLSLLLTLVVEIPVLFLAAKYLLKIKIQAKEIFYWGAFVNLFSLPYLWFIFPLFISSRNYILIGEILVILIEFATLLKVLKIDFKKAFVLSLVANLASYLTGTAINIIL
ncbi:hypothetical protein KKE78_00340 [Patescibacteria group bacterium]|nr:hypothetical protein [Patescibacteria group bacterium]